MKAERRHELQTNTLAKVITGAGEADRSYIGKVALAVVIVACVAFLIRARVSATAERKEGAALALATVRLDLETFRKTDLSRYQESGLSNYAKVLLDRDSRLAQQAYDDAPDAKLKAQSLVARGDLNWTLANLPPLPSAATQPSIALPKTADEFTKSATLAYQQVLDQYAGEKETAAHARLGLAAVAENAGNWDDAKKFYTAVQSDPAVPQTLRDYSDMRLGMIPGLQQPVVFGTPTTQPMVLIAPATTVPSK